MPIVKVSQSNNRLCQAKWQHFRESHDLRKLYFRYMVNYVDCLSLNLRCVTFVRYCWCYIFLI